SGSATADAVSWGAAQIYNDENGAAPALRSETVVKTDYDRGRALVPEVKEINGRQRHRRALPSSCEVRTEPQNHVTATKTADLGRRWVEGAPGQLHGMRGRPARSLASISRQ